MKHFFVCPATFDIPNVMIRLTTGPKKPMIEYPATGDAAWSLHELLQMRMQPARTGRQQRISIMIPILGIFELR
jgi:hypothetical protein